MIQYVASDRYVVTFQKEVDGWPVGILTGHGRGTTYHLEHVVVFAGAPRGTLMQMLRHGIEEAWRREFKTIVLQLPHAFPLRRPLEAVGRRLGFEPYAEEAETTWYVLYRP